MLQTETLTKKKKNDLLHIADCFDLFGQEVKMEQFVKQTDFSRKKVWNLLKKMEKAKGVETTKKGFYRPLYPRLNELRVYWGGEVTKFTVEDFIDRLKKGKMQLQKEQLKENPATLWLNTLDLSSEISNLKEEQKQLEWIKNRLYAVQKKSKNPKRLRAYAVFGLLYWEEPNAHTANFDGIEKKNGD